MLSKPAFVDVEREEKTDFLGTGNEHVKKFCVENLVHIVKTAWPQTLVIFLKTLVALEDMIVIGHLGKTEFAAAAMCNVIMNATGSFIWSGIGVTLIALTSQAMGCKNFELSFVWLQISAFFGVLLSIPVILLWSQMGKLVALLPLEDSFEKAEVTAMASKYGRLSILWLVPDVLATCFQQWLQGLNLVRASLRIEFVFAVLNLFLNLFLVFGIGPFQGLGLIGSPLATFATLTMRLFALLHFIMPQVPPECTRAGFNLKDLTSKRLLTFMNLFVPNGFSAMVDSAVMIVMTVLIAPFGVTKVAAQSAMIDIYDFMTAPIYGLESAGEFLIATELGRGRIHKAKEFSWAVMEAMIGVGFGIGFLFFAFRHVLGKLFTRDEEIIGLMSELSIATGFTYTLIAIAHGTYTILQAQSRPTPAMLTFLIGTWFVGLPFGWFLSAKTSVGWIGVWIGLSAGDFVTTTGMILLIVRSDWQSLVRAARIRSEVHPEDGGGSSEVELTAT